MEADVIHRLQKCCEKLKNALQGNFNSIACLDTFHVCVEREN